MLLHYTITEENSISIINLSGELIDKNQANDLILSIDELLNSNKLKLVLNLQDLKYLNSSGLNVLIQLLTKTRNKGGDVVICHVNKKISELLLITKLNTLFKIAETTEEAAKLLN